MPDELDLFVGNSEPIKLFDVLRDQCQPEHPWPILYVIGPPGAGKTTLTKHLHRGMRHTIFPHIRINFQHENVPRQPLRLLVTIRDEFRRHADGNGLSLRFPLFDFGALLVRAAQEQGNATLSPEEAVEHVYRNSAILDRWMETTGALGNQITIVPALMIVLKSALDVEPISRFMQGLRDGVVWEWYRRQASRLGLSADQDIKVLMEQLYELAREEGNEELLEELLVEAFFADLAAAFMPSNDVQRPWPKAHRAVIFMDNFDVLINNSATDAERLLELLALYMPVRKGAPTSLLLVVASELPLDGASLMLRTPLRYNDAEMLQYAQNRFSQWLRGLPRPYSRVKLNDLFWSVELHSFSLAETRSYLLRYGTKNNLSIFEDDPLLIDHIYKLTYGYQAAVHLVARAAQRTGRLRYTDSLGTLSVGNKTVADELYENFMRPFDRDFQDQLIFCALPLALDKGLLKELLDPKSFIQLDRLWNILQSLPFIRMRRDEKLVFHPLVRRLLLMRFKPETDNHEYLQVHDRLQRYFEQRNAQDDEAMVARAYHALLQGKFEDALVLGRQLFHRDQNRWRTLLTTVDDVPFGPEALAVDRALLGPRADQAMDRFQQTRHDEDGADAVLLYRWLLTEPLTDQQKDRCWRNLSFCYAHLNGAATQEDMRRVADQMVKLGHRQINAQANVRPGGSTAIASASNQTMPIWQPGGGNGRGPNNAAGSTTQSATAPASPPATQPSGPLSSQPGSSTTGSSTRPRGCRIDIHRIFPPRRRRRVGRQNGILLLTIGVVVLALFACPIISTIIQNDATALLSPAATPTPGLITNPPAPQPHTPDKNGMGVTLRNGEYVGLSEGSFPFDTTGRPDSADKTKAADNFLQQGPKGAVPLWEKAIGSSTVKKDNDDEPNDAEVQIYLQNQQFADTCIGIVVATDLSRNTGSGVTIGRDELQGAYLVQRAQNDSPEQMKVCLYVANMGDDARDANAVAQQIVQAMPKYRIKAVVGWPAVDASDDAVRTLDNAHLVVISADAYRHQRDPLPNLFHVIPSNETEGQQDALYVEHRSQAKRVAILSAADEKNDTYSMGLKSGFVRQLQSDGEDGLIVDSLQYQGNDFASIIKQLAEKQPDLIYFTGGIDDALSMLSNLKPGLFSDHLRVLGGHKLYQLVGYSGLQPSGIQFLDFSASGYPDQGSVLTMKQQYAKYFDQGDTNTSFPRVYGYSRPDNDAISSYNAMSVLMVALRSLGPSSQFQPAQVMNALKQNPFQLIGTSQRANGNTFNDFNEPAKPDLLIIHVDKDLHLQAENLIS